MFKKILIANRGEIALRVMRTCREMGIEVVAVFSEADRTAPHVLFADEAYHIGPAPSTESYLNYAKILEVARESGAEAIHPGYGFLSENTDFASDVSKAGIVFIGPPASAIKIMGDKTMARQTMLKTQVPVVPGTEEPIADISKAQKVAEEIGFPVLIKAAGGGGGKGMRIVNSSDEFEDAVGKAERESQSAFGDGRVYVEKYLEEPHHIEFQILADTHGNTIHLNERECSIQRRYQKVIEESPSPFIDDSLRSKMGQAAVETAESCKYVGAGTVEFLVDKHRNFYFLEMNTRLQVEHPVTEMITGIDIVREQLRVAAGEPLSFQQKDIKITGHAIECRINAEDAKTFMPSPGKINQYHSPGGPGIRVDTHIYDGYVVPPYYDSMIAKLIAHGDSRESALARMRTALGEMVIDGIRCNIELHEDIMRDASFCEGGTNIHYLEKKLGI